MATTTGHIVMVHFTQRLHSWIGDHSWFWLSCLDPLVLLLHLTSQSFDFERIWWRLFQKCTLNLISPFLLMELLNCRYTAQFM
jgi:hypothetical protein